MEPFGVLVGSTIALILSEASKEGGKSLGKATFEQIARLKKLIASKLGKKEEALFNYEPEVLEGELIEALENDNDFASQLRLAVESARSQPELRQIILENAKGGSLKIEETVQEKGNANQNVTQVIGRNLDIDGEISISNTTQK